jgi:hypothetical protein
MRPEFRSISIDFFDRKRALPVGDLNLFSSTGSLKAPGS